MQKALNCSLHTTSQVYSTFLQHLEGRNKIIPMHSIIARQSMVVILRPHVKLSKSRVGFFEIAYKLYLQSFKWSIM